MDFPFAIYVGETKVLLHVFTEVLSVFIGFRYFLFLRKSKADIIETNTRIWIIIGAIFGAVIGSRLIGGLENIALLKKTGNKLFYFYQNKTVVGGFLFGVWGVEMVKLVIGEKKASGDLFVYPMLLALIIGRIGCFSMGIFEETYGIESSLPWAMNLGDGLLRHPVTIYEILFLILLWTSLVLLEKKHALVNGGKFKILMISYLFFRFFLDFIKPHYTFSMGLSTIQITCVVGLIYYRKYILKPKSLVLFNK